MRTQWINQITLASKPGQCSTMLFMNKFTISFIKSDREYSGTNGKTFYCPTEYVNFSYVIQYRQ